MAFANCYIVRDGERIVHASGCVRPRAAAIGRLNRPDAAANRNVTPAADTCSLPSASHEVCHGAHHRDLRSASVADARLLLVESGAARARWRTRHPTP